MNQHPIDGDPRDGRRRSTAGALRRLYGAELLSGAGDGIFWVALVATLANDRRFDVLLVGAIVARLGPRAVLGIAAGRLVDRSNIVTVIVGTDLVRGAMMAGLAVIVALGAGSLPILLIVLLAYVVGVPTRPAISALVPHLTDETHLASANANLSTIRQVMTFVGPMAGVAVVAWSTTAAFAANAISFLLSALLVGGVQAGRRTRSSVHQRPEGRTAAERAVPPARGFVPEAPGLMILVALVAAMYFVRGAEMVLHVLVVTDLLGQDPSAIGYLGAGVGLGALVAAPLARRGANTDQPVMPIAVALLLTALPTFALCFVDRLAAAIALLVLVGFALVVFEVVSVATLQRTVPRSSLGTVFGIVNSSSNGGKLVGAAAASALAALFGTRAALVAAAAATLIAGAITLPRLTRLGRASAERRRQLQPYVDVLSSLGLFDGTHRVDLERIAASLSEEELPAGDTIIHEGTDPVDLFIVRRGEFDVSVAGRLLNQMGPGDWFGEIGLVERIPRTATVTARTEATIWRIPGDVFLAVLGESGAPPAALVQAITERMARGHL